MKNRFWGTASVGAGLLAFAAFSTVVISGCDRKETIIDVDTPGGGVEVERDIDDGEVTVDVE